LKLIWCLAFILAGLFFLLLLVYFLDNPADRTSYLAKYPYILSIKPGLVTKDANTAISFSSFEISHGNEKYSLAVVNPEGHAFVNNNLIPSNSLKFPDDFIGASTQLTGNYSASVLNRNNVLLISSHFQVLVNPSLSLFTNFVFGSGLAITIGLIGTMVTMAYQVVSQHNQDRGRRLDERAKWMLDNSKTYFTLYGDSLGVCSAFIPIGSKKPNYTKFNTRDILFSIIRFYHDYGEFTKTCGFYYFDDYHTEDFLTKVDAKIFDLMDEMTGEYSELKVFFDIKTQSEFQVHPKYKMYQRRVKLWLSDRKNAEKLYLTHLVYNTILLVSINKALQITYGSTSKIKQGVEADVQTDKKYLDSHISRLNYEFYGANKNLHYSLYDSRGNLNWN